MQDRITFRLSADDHDCLAAIAAGLKAKRATDGGSPWATAGVQLSEAVREAIRIAAGVAKAAQGVV